MQTKLFATSLRRFPQVLILRKNHSSTYAKKFWDWTTQERPSWKENYVEAAVAFTVFGVTGSSTMFLVRPMLSMLGLKGTLVEGPWSYRIGSILIISPIYACMLLTLGTLSGRHRFFAGMSFKMLNRFFPKTAIKKVVCTPAVKKTTS
mmetsp:Transcript_17421/g.17508  ORF Transcript_17421/g.17508 Transcript_17421/m.17508 type:complete len:148 (-) Transcript_17421:78-521(-)